MHAGHVWFYKADCNEAVWVFQAKALELAMTEINSKCGSGTIMRLGDHQQEAMYVSKHASAMKVEVTLSAAKALTLRGTCAARVALEYS